MTNIHHNQIIHGHTCNVQIIHGHTLQRSEHFVICNAIKSLHNFIISNLMLLYQKVLLDRIEDFLSHLFYFLFYKNLQM